MESQNHQRKEVMPLTEEDAVKFVGAKALDAEWTKERLPMAFTACIDDRYSGEVSESEPRVKIPGDKLGLGMDVVAGLNKFLQDRGEGNFIFDCKEVIKAVESVVGPLTYHTDEMSESQHGFACQGCGYCNSSLQESEEFLLPDKAVEFFRQYVPSLEERGVKPVVLSGLHGANGVFVIDALDIVMPTIDDDEHRAYVYNRGLHRQVLKELAEVVLPIVAQAYSDATQEDVSEALLKAADIRVGKIVDLLASDKPKYVVMRSESHQVLVRDMAEVSDEDDEAVEGEASGVEM